MNPYAPEEMDPQQVKRKAQIQALTGAPTPTASSVPPNIGGSPAMGRMTQGIVDVVSNLRAPTSNTMPVGTRAPLTPPVTTPPALGAGAPPAIGGAPPSGGRRRTGAAPGGFSQANWDDPNMQSVKYAAGSFLSGATRPSEVAAIVNSPEFQQRFPGATFNGKDMIDFAGALSDGDSGVPVGLVDVLRSADRGGDTSEGFWWGANEAGGDFVPSDGSGRESFAQGGFNPAGDSSALAQIMKELEAMRDGQQSPSQRDAIMSILGGA